MGRNGFMWTERRETMGKGGKVPAWLESGGLLLLMEMALFTCLWKTYGLPISMSRLFGACVLAAVCVTGVWQMPRYRKTVMAAGTLLLIGVTAMEWEEIGQGCMAVWEAVNQTFHAAVGVSASVSFPADWTAVQRETAATKFLGILVFFWAGLLGWTVFPRRRPWAAVLLTLPWLFPAFLAQLPLFWGALAVLAACWMTLFLLRGNRGTGPSTGMALPGFLISLLLLFCLTSVEPREGYVQPSWAVQLRQRLEQIEWESGTESQPEMGEPILPVDLGMAGPRRYTGQKILELETVYQGSLYLRGCSYGTYSDDGVWSGLEETALDKLARAWSQSGFLKNSLLLPPIESDTPIYQIKLRAVQGNGGMVYTPYQLTEIPRGGEIRFLQDAWFHTEGKDAWSMRFQIPDDQFEDLMTGKQQAEETYRTFVEQWYVSVPKQTRAVLQSWLTELGETPPDGADRLAVAQWYADQLAACCQYDDQTPAVHGNVFLEHFLRESRRGYCVHFATALTLLLRMEGIPARYVSGYLVETGSERTVFARDRNAHAWTEVYLERYGWYPVEATPAGEGGISDGEDIPAEQEQPDFDGLEPIPEPETLEGGERERFGAHWLLFLVGLGLVLWGMRGLRRWQWSRICTRPDRNRAVLDAYGWYCRLQFWGGREIPVLEELARKSRYSAHTLTESERRTAVSALEREIRRCGQALPPWKRVVFWFFLAPGKKFPGDA